MKFSLFIPTICDKNQCARPIPNLLPRQHNCRISRCYLGNRLYHHKELNRIANCQLSIEVNCTPSANVPSECYVGIAPSEVYTAVYIAVVEYELYRALCKPSKISLIAILVKLMLVIHTLHHPPSLVDYQISSPLVTHTVTIILYRAQSLSQPFVSTC